VHLKNTLWKTSWRRRIVTTAGKEKTAAAREVARDFIYEYLSTHPCVGLDQKGCPYHETDPRVLEIHHLYGKDMAVSAMVSRGYSIKRIQAEIDKSIVLCANCHRKLTVEERGWFRKSR
jgi:hypothetical protein